jgi:hypothetical protein
MSAGTASELALAMKTGRPAILIRQSDSVVRTFTDMASGHIETADSAETAVEIARALIATPA